MNEYKRGKGICPGLNMTEGELFWYSKINGMGIVWTPVYVTTQKWLLSQYVNASQTNTDASTQ